MRVARSWPQREANAGPRRAPWSPGLSVLIPDRARPDLLETCLPALMDALGAVDEPWEVWVSSSDAAPDRYAALRARFPAVRWLHSPRPLGFSGALARGLPRLRHDHTYLLNNDMRLEADALREVLLARADDVFAVASQIHMADPTARREETGLTALCRFGAPSQLYDAWPGTDPALRAHLYAGGGASLFRTAALRRYAAASRIYEPAYWEDVEWGVRAWQEGWRVLFCPRSQAWHAHRSTMRDVFGQAETERLFRRNNHWFDLRHAPLTQVGTALDRVVRSDVASSHDARGWRFAHSMLASRWRQRHAALPSGWFQSALPLRVGWGRAIGARPRVLVVSPFALLPTNHGGARRTLELLRELSERFELALVCDEGDRFPHGFEVEFEPLLSLWILLHGRADAPAAESWPRRAERHAWQGLSAAVHQARALFQPQHVVVSHAELLDLAQGRAGGERWWIDLHDVPDMISEERRWFASALARFDAALACSVEDLAQLPAAAPSHLLENGARLRPDLPPSPSSPPTLLFVGSLRYPPNQRGLQAFLDTAWGPLRQRFPALRLQLAGIEADDAKARLRGIDDAVLCLGHHDDLGPIYAAATLCLNPLTAIRGSALKAIEALAAGRMCVSTREGARGLTHLELPGLQLTDSVAAMAAAIGELLDDASQRHRRERFDAKRLAAFAWSARAKQLGDWLDPRA